MGTNVTLTKTEILAIFEKHWPELGYAGVKPFLPQWTQRKAAKFAWRQQIKMSDAARKANNQVNMAKARAQRGQPVKPVESVASRLLMRRW